jgi:hypothetical protein
MGSVVSGVGQALGFESTYQGPSAQSQEYMDNLRGIASGTTESPAAKGFALNANKALRNTTMGVQSMRGLNSAQRGNALGMALSNQNAELSQQAGINEMNYRMSANSMLGNALMGYDSMQNNANQAKAGRFAGLLGAGMTAAGMAFGGPAGALAGSVVDTGGAGSGSSGVMNPQNYSMGDYKF